ncbi:MAG: amino acid permease [Bacteroidetes bacterium]|nr:amino acid permease [Bacteroidota bacterium]MBK9425666.1 amino acid permease [Bacteroidota bacterium]
MNLFRKKSIHDILQQVKEGDESVHGKLKKHLGVRDLTAFGIAAIIGAGIFSTIGKASADGGPAVILLFIFTAIACSLAAFCYAEFSSMVPVSGSAYTYSYVSFGELFAWIIGWALIMEYAIGNIVVAISWSGYFSSLLTHLHIPALGFPDGIHLPAWSGIDYFSAKRAFESAAANPADTTILNSEGYLAWISAPAVAGIKIIMDIPALVINILITWLVYRGIKETRNASNLMVAIKVSVVIMVIALGISYVDTDNWTPFMPEGLGGVLAGVSAVFFAYIGFDAISTTAEECHNPQRDLPKGMMYAIIICTILYILIALVLTGMVNYTELAVDDPLAFVFSRLGLDWISGIIAVSAVVAMASVLLVFQLGQPRIWMSMSRDGLLPKAFSRVHPKYGTPGFATIITGLTVGVPIFFIDMNTVVDLCSIGTLFAFILVCGGVLMLQKHTDLPRKFRVPFINGKFIVPVLYLITTVYVGFYQREWAHENLNPLHNVEAIPMFIFFIVFAVLAFYSATRNLSLIPVLGILTCLYLMAQIHLKNWIGFTIWLIAGLIIYFGFSYKNSKLNKARLQS